MIYLSLVGVACTEIYYHRTYIKKKRSLFFKLAVQHIFILLITDLFSNAVSLCSLVFVIHVSDLDAVTMKINIKIQDQ